MRIQDGLGNMNLPKMVILMLSLLNGIIEMMMVFQFGLRNSEQSNKS